MNLANIESYAKELMKHSGHSFDHVKRVYDLCFKVSKSMKELNIETLLVSALMHDIARSNEFETGECHAKTGAKWAKEYLESINYETNKIEKIVYCIKSHRYSNGVIPQTLEAKVLQECDRVDAIGAIGTIRTTVHNYNKLPYDEKDPLAKNRIIDDNVYGLDHFYLKLLKLKDELLIPEIKKEAIKRHEFMLELLKTLEKEVVLGEKKDAALLIDIIRKNHELPIYELGNPFNEKIDTIISKIMGYKNHDFVSKFLKQLKSEIL